MSYFYYEGADGRHYCYASAPTFVCTAADFRRDDDGNLRPPRRVRRAAEELGMEPEPLARMIYNRHTANWGARRREDGKLTDRCKTCGGKMARLGFRVWIEERPEEDSQSRIAGRLGFSDYREVPGSGQYLRTKREASAWVSEQVEATKAAAT